MDASPLDFDELRLSGSAACYDPGHHTLSGLVCDPSLPTSSPQTIQSFTPPPRAPPPQQSLRIVPPRVLPPSGAQARSLSVTTPTPLYQPRRRRRQTRTVPYVRQKKRRESACPAAGCRNIWFCTRKSKACPFCRKLLHNHKRNFNTHLRSHGQGDASYCDVCEQEFASESNLRAHKKTKKHAKNSRRKQESSPALPASPVSTSASSCSSPSVPHLALPGPFPQDAYVPELITTPNRSSTGSPVLSVSDDSSSDMLLDCAGPASFASPISPSSSYTQVQSPASSSIVSVPYSRFQETCSQSVDTQSTNVNSYTPEHRPASYQSSPLHAANGHSHVQGSPPQFQAPHSVPHVSPTTVGVESYLN